MAVEVVDLFEFTPINYQIGDKTKFDEDTKTLILTEKQMNALEALNSKLNFLEITRKTLKPQNLVGVVAVEGLTLQILPKLLKTANYDELEKKKQILIGNLIKMLSVGGEIPVKPSEIANIDMERAPFLEVLITIYSTKLLEILKYHRYYRYRQIEEDLNHVKGQINFTRYAARWDRRHVVPIRHNERTMDNLLNRTLKYGAYLMARLTKSRDNYQRLKGIMAILEGVPVVQLTPYETYKIHFNRLNAVFKPLVELARIFIGSSTLKLQTGSIETFTFLLPMEKVFENFIAGILTSPEFRGVLGEWSGARIQSQHHIGTLLAEGQFGLIPDITVETSRYRVILDTKYKVLKREDRKLGVSQGDLYQMYAYATHWNANAVVLLYPSITGEIKKTWHFNVPTTAGTRKVPLLIRTVDLSHDFLGKGWEVFLGDIRELIAEIFRSISE